MWIHPWSPTPTSKIVHLDLCKSLCQALVKVLWSVLPPLVAVIQDAGCRMQDAGRMQVLPEIWTPIWKVQAMIYERYMEIIWTLYDNPMHICCIRDVRYAFHISSQCFHNYLLRFSCCVVREWVQCPRWWCAQAWPSLTQPWASPEPRPPTILGLSLVPGPN